MLSQIRALVPNFDCMSYNAKTIFLLNSEGAIARMVAKYCYLALCLRKDIPVFRCINKNDMICTKSGRVVKKASRFLNDFIYY